MRAIACCCLLFCSALLGAAEYRPAKALITMKNGDEAKPFFVKTVGIDKVYAGPTEDFQAEIKFRDIKTIEWTELHQNMHFAKATGDLKSQRYQSAIDNFEKVVGLRKQVCFIKANEGIADAYAAMKEYDKAIAALDKIIAEESTWPWLPELIYRKGEIQMTAGKLADADATFAGLAKLSSTFGATAESSSLLGRAQVKVAQKKPGEAATLLAEAFGKTSADTNPELRGRIGLKLAAQQNAADQADAAQTTLEQIKFLPLPADDLSRVHSQLADILLAKGKLREAFDHAVFGVLVPDVGGDAGAQARAVARKIRSAIEQDESFSNEEKLAYRQAYDKL